MPPARKTTAKAQTPRPAPTTGDAEARIAALTAQLEAANDRIAAAEGTPPGPGTGDTSALSGSAAGETRQAPKPSTRGDVSLKAGQVVRLAPDEDNPDAPAQYAQVVETVAGTKHRDAGALIVPLPEPRYVPASDLATD